MSIRRPQGLTSVITLVLLSVILLTSCGTFAEGSDGRITITIHTWEAGATGLHVYEQAIPEFEKAHPDIKVEIDSDTSSYYYSKLLTSLANGNGPDIFLVFDTSYPRFVNSGTVLDLTKYAQEKKYGIDPDKFYTSAWDMGTFKGQSYFLPKDLAVQSVLYNKTLFKQAGIPFPKAGWTMQDFADAAKKLTVTKNGRTEQWGSLLPGDYLPQGLEYMLPAYGGQFLSPDGKTADGYLNSPASEKAIAAYLDMYKQGISPTMSQTSGFGNLDLFQTGRVAMKWDSTWSMGTYLEDPKLEFDSVPMPLGSTGKSLTTSYVGGLAINSRSPHTEEAAEVLGFFASQRWAEINRYIATPALKGKAAEDMQREQPEYKAFFDQANVATRPPELSTLNWGKDVSQPLVTFLDNMILEPDRNLHEELQQTVEAIDAQLAETYSYEG
jgi:multiple sugar transport system substrate-binding protein